MRGARTQCSAHTPSLAAPPTAGLYCATQPSLSCCSGITIACWAGAYPGLSAHFAAANLDPKQNHWSNVSARCAVL